MFKLASVVIVVFPLLILLFTACTPAKAYFQEFQLGLPPRAANSYSASVGNRYPFLVLSIDTVAEVICLSVSSLIISVIV